MPFDGVVTKCVVNELSEILIDARVEKIFQPEGDEIIMNIRAKGQNLKLILSANANYPRIHLTETSKENPANPPVFCMVLRKHLSGGRIIGVDFYDFERIISIQIESTNELGDVTVKKLIIEIMGRHSNIILVNHEDKILDCIKHVDSEVSSVREVMPARPYVLPPAQDKTSPVKLDIDKFIADATNSDSSLESYLLNGIKGFSPLLCREICHRAGIDGKRPASTASRSDGMQLKKILQELIFPITECHFSPCIIFNSTKEGKPFDFHCVQIFQYANVKYYTSISAVLDAFYAEKDRIESLKQKRADLVKLLNNNLDRCRKKISLQQEKLSDVADREKIKLYGELITANIYCIPKCEKKVSLLNYYSENGDYIDVPLNENLSPQENAQRYFKQYSKAKSAYFSTSIQLEDSLRELEYLESVLHMLESSNTIQEIGEIRQELIEQKYISPKKKDLLKRGYKQTKTASFLKFKSSDGLDIFVGKNNKQNDALTLKTASANDIWLHTRNIPGSHVVIKKQQQPIPDSTLLEAATIAAFHSKAKLSSNVPIDYTTVRNVKKPNGAKPGMVIYENFKTVIVSPNEDMVNRLKVDK